MSQVQLSRRTPTHAAGLSRRGSVLKGCLIAVAIFVALVVIGIVVVVMNWRSWFSSAVGAGIEAMVNSSYLPPTEKQEVMVHVDQLMADFKAGKVSVNDLGRVAEELQDSPVFPVGATLWFEQAYVAPSAMPDDEKAAARRTMDRFARGLYEEKIPVSASDDVLAPMMETTPEGEQQIKENPTIDEIRAALANMKQRADDVNMPDESFEIDISDEVEKAIERALAEPSGQAAPADGATEPTEPADSTPAEPAPAPDGQG